MMSRREKVTPATDAWGTEGGRSELDSKLLKQRAVEKEDRQACIAQK